MSRAVISPAQVREQERAASAALYPSRRNVIAAPIHPPVKGPSDDDRSSRAPEQRARQ